MRTTNTANKGKAATAARKASSPAPSTTSREDASKYTSVAVPASTHEDDAEERGDPGRDAGKERIRDAAGGKDAAEQSENDVLDRFHVLDDGNRREDEGARRESRTEGDDQRAEHRRGPAGEHGAEDQDGGGEKARSRFQPDGADGAEDRDRERPDAETRGGASEGKQHQRDRRRREKGRSHELGVGQGGDAREERRAKRRRRDAFGADGFEDRVPGEEEPDEDREADGALRHTRLQHDQRQRAGFAVGSVGGELGSVGKGQEAHGLMDESALGR